MLLNKITNKPLLCNNPLVGHVKPVSPFTFHVTIRKPHYSTFMLFNFASNWQGVGGCCNCLYLPTDFDYSRICSCVLPLEVVALAGSYLRTYMQFPLKLRNNCFRTLGPEWFEEQLHTRHRHGHTRVLIWKKSFKPFSWSVFTPVLLRRKSTPIYMK